MEWGEYNHIGRYKSSSRNKNLIFGCHAMLNLNNHITFRFPKNVSSPLDHYPIIMHTITLFINLLRNYTVYIRKMIVLFLSKLELN